MINILNNGSRAKFHLIGIFFKIEPINSIMSSMRKKKLKANIKDNFELPNWKNESRD